MLTATKSFDELVTFNRTSSATYFDANGVLQTASEDEPRFDHDPVTGEPLGLLCEEQRTNLNPRSNTFNWSESNSSGVATDTRFVEDAVAVGPDGTMTASRVTASSGNDLQRIYKPISATGNYIHSVWMKADSNNFGGIKFTTGDLLAVNLTDGSVVASPSTQRYGVEPGPDGWFRLWIENFDDNAVCQIILFNGTTSSFAGNGESIFVWGHQLEEGSFPTSYIPTSGAASTRTPDYARMGSLSPWFKQGGGTLYVRVQAKPYYVGGLQSFMLINDSSTNRYNAFIRLTPFGVNAVTRYGSGSTVSSLFSEAEIGEIGDIRSAYSYAENDFGFSVNGLPAKRDSNGLINQAQDTLKIGEGFGVWANGHIKEIRFYPYNMSNEELEALTA